jgi:hypothetical protein
LQRFAALILPVGQAQEVKMRRVKKSEPQRLLLVLIVLGGVVILSGCASAVCEKGPQPLSGKWAEMKLPTVTGAEVCHCDEKEVRIVHRNAEYFELVDQYAEKFKSEGWSVSPAQRTEYARIFKVSKDKDSDFSKNYMTLRFKDCEFPSLRDRMSKCTQIEIY